MLTLTRDLFKICQRAHLARRLAKIQQKLTACPAPSARYSRLVYARFDTVRQLVNLTEAAEVQHA